MKYLSAWISLFFSVAVLAQPDGVCYVTSVKGEVWNREKKIVKAGDTISYIRIPELKSYSDEGLITFYHPKAGSFRAYTKNLQTTPHKEGVFDFVMELLKMKGKSISLASRGECQCAMLYDCLYTDANINQNLLLFDTLSFPVEEDISDSCFYFLQLKTSNGVISNTLKNVKETVIITPYDLMFNGFNYFDHSAEPLVLGKCKWVNGKKTFSMVSNLRFTLVSSSFLLSYYQVLQKAMNGYTPKDVYETYYRDIYVFYGKPAHCQLKKLIGYTD